MAMKSPLPEVKDKKKKKRIRRPEVKDKDMKNKVGCGIFVNELYTLPAFNTLLVSRRYTR